MKKIIILCIAALTCLAFASCGKQDTSGDVMAAYNAAKKLIDAGDYDAAEKIIDDAASKYGDGAMLDSLRRKMAPVSEPQAEEETAAQPAADDVFESVTEPYTDTGDDYLDDGLYPNDIFLDGEDLTAVYTTVAPVGESAQQSTTCAAAKTTTGQTTRRSGTQTTRPATTRQTTRPAATRQTTTQQTTTQAATTQAVTVTAPTNAHNTARDRATALSKTYLEQSSDSRSQLIARITENGFSEAEAAYAADHCGADWNNQAFKAAKKYAADGSASGGFSAKSMKKQLQSDGFTESEASYAVDHASIDWNAQAIKTAKTYLQLRKSATDYSGGFSYDSLVRQLEKAGFTHEQAVYGASRCGADWNEQAVLSAKALLHNDPEMTDKTLSEQLTTGELFGGFTAEQARYAVAHCR